MTGSSVATTDATQYITSLQSSKLRSIATLLFKEGEGFDDYLHCHRGVGINDMDDLLTYRTYRISMENVTMEEFSMQCDNGICEAVQRIFYQPISEYDMVYLNGMIESLGYSRCHIYNKLRSNNNQSIFQIIL